MSIFSFFKKNKAIEKLIKEEQDKAKELRMSLLKTANKMAMLDGENHWFLSQRENRVVENERVTDCVINNRRGSDKFKTKCHT
jgi:hypothetical protein